MNLNNVLARAQQMMLDENWNRQVEMGAAAQRAGSINGGGNRGGSNDLAALEAQVFGTAISEPRVDTNYFTPIPESAKNFVGNTPNGQGIQILQETREPFDPNKSKLPKSVVESFMKTPTPLDDSLIDMPASFALPQQPQQLNEQQYSAPRPQVAPATAGIDYNYLNYLINEAVKNAMKGMLNESVGANSFKGMRFVEGNTFQFIDAKGNLYEGVLKLKKKAAQK